MCTTVSRAGAWAAQRMAVAGEPLMETAASTTTRDILGLALLAVLSARPSSRTEAVEAVRGLCLPWLTPTREVLAGLIYEYCETGLVCAARGFRGDARPLDGALLEMTPDGAAILILAPGRASRRGGRRLSPASNTRTPLASPRVATLGSQNENCWSLPFLANAGIR